MLIPSITLNLKYFAWFAKIVVCVLCGLERGIPFFLFLVEKLQKKAHLISAS